MKLDGTRSKNRTDQAMEMQWGVIGACDDCLPEHRAAQVEVRFGSVDYPTQALSLCPACLIARLADGEHIVELLICDEAPVCLHQVSPQT